MASSPVSFIASQQAVCLSVTGCISVTVCAGVEDQNSVKDQQAAKLAQTTAGGKPLPQHDWMHHFQLPRFLSPTAQPAGSNDSPVPSSHAMLADTFRRGSFSTQEEIPGYQVQIPPNPPPLHSHYHSVSVVAHAVIFKETEVVLLKYVCLMQSRPITDSHLQYSEADVSMLNSFMTKTHGTRSHDNAPFLQTSNPLNLPHAHAQPLVPGMLPEDALRRETRSVPPHLYGSRNDGPSGIPEGECAATAAAQLLFSDKNIPGVGNGTHNLPRSVRAPVFLPIKPCSCLTLAC